MSYRDVLKVGWKTGVHDCRPYHYQHPWIVVHRPSGTVEGCWSRWEARQLLAKLKSTK